MWTRYKADGNDLREVLFFAEQCAFVCSLNTESKDDVPEGTDDEEAGSDFEKIVIAKKVALSGFCGILREVQIVCEGGGGAVAATVVEVVNLAREGVIAKRENAALPKRNKDMEADPVKFVPLKVRYAGSSQGQSVE